MPALKTRGRWYAVEDAVFGQTVMRPNRIAAGMTRCASRRSEDARALAVYGTLDSLAGLLNWNTKRSPRVCPCCGQRVNAVILSDRGRRKLAALRRAAR